MRPGPRPDPPEVRKLKGRRVPAKTPKRVAGTLTCPRHLKGQARATWYEVVAWLTAARTLGLECAPLVERYSLTFARWREAEAQLAAGGMMLKAEGTGTLYPSPWLYVTRGEGAVLLKLEAELGLGPSARGRVTTAPPLEDLSSEWFLLKKLQGGKA
jgi:P27 family predicted phage terminase small subunit